MTSRTVAIWIVMNESGECEVATDEDKALDRWNDEFGQDAAGAVCRLVKLNVTMAAPLVTEVDVAVPDEAGRTVKVEIE